MMKDTHNACKLGERGWESQRDLPLKQQELYHTSIKDVNYVTVNCIY